MFPPATRQIHNYRGAGGGTGVTQAEAAVEEDVLVDPVEKEEQGREASLEG